MILNSNSISGNPLRKHWALPFIKVNDQSIKMKHLLLIAIGILVGSTAIAEDNSTIQGTLVDGQFGGPMIGATVSIPSLPGVGATTDFDGNFSLSVAPGKYDVVVSFISYESITYQDLEVKAGEVIRIDAELKIASQEVEMVTVTAKAKESSEAGALIAMKNASVVSDGLSAQSFKKAGDSDLGGAIKRVTGVTVQDGKYVYVRGLGDRYTKSLLNGMVLPGLDPDINSVQIDIFPTAVLENVNVFKSFSPELNADFAGGLVNVVTKKFPSEKMTQLSLGFSYVPGMNFNPDFILYTPGKFDALGFDDGSRAMPITGETEIPDEALLETELENITRSFNSELAAKKRFAFLNTSFSFNHGNKIEKNDNLTVGYNLVLNYNNSNTFYSGFQSNDYLRSTDSEATELEKQRLRIGDVGKNTVTWNALGSLSFKRKNSTITAVALYNQSGESVAAQRTSTDVEQNQATLSENVLTYTQRSLGTLQLSGEHKVKSIDVKWANSFSYSRVYDPDFRETRISITDGDTALTTGNGAGIDRFWRNLNEFNESFRVDLRIPVHKNISIKTGAINTFKTRTFEVHSFKHRPNNLSEISLDPDWFLQDENIWSADPESDNYRDGTYTIGNFQLANQYDAKQNVAGAYVMAEQNIKNRLNLIYGVRVEHAIMFYNGQNSSGTERYLNENTLNKINVLPAVNMVFKATDKMNVRAGYGRTVARPSFKEKSIAEIYDPITKRTFIGNIDLQQVNIDNADLRYEYFIGGKDMVAISGFYKHFDGHIEMVSFELQPDNLKPRNSGAANLFGGELEIRKGLRQHTTSKFLQGFYFTANLTVVKSMVDMSTVMINNDGDSELELRQRNARSGEAVNKFRLMSGQSPYAVNASISYAIADRANLSITYNVQGDQLSVIGSGRVPDVYTLSYHSLNLNAYVDLGQNKGSRITLGVNNLLDQERTMVYRSFEAEDQVFTSFKPGVQFRVKYSFRF